MTVREWDVFVIDAKNGNLVSRKPIVSVPGRITGHNWGRVSYNDVTGLVYIPGVRWMWRSRPVT